MNFLFRNKKGNAIIETLTFIVVLFVVVLVWLSTHYIQRELNDDVQQDDTLATENKQLNQDLVDSYPNLIDGGILFFFIVFWALILIASYMIDTHPAFFIFSFIMLIFVFVIVIYLANTFDDIFSTELPGLNVYFPFTFFIFGNLLPISIVVGFTVLLVMYARLK